MRADVPGHATAGVAPDLAPRRVTTSGRAADRDGQLRRPGVRFVPGFQWGLPLPQCQRLAHRSYPRREQTVVPDQELDYRLQAARVTSLISPPAESLMANEWAVNNLDPIDAGGG